MDFSSFLTQEFQDLVTELRCWTQDVAGFAENPPDSWPPTAVSLAFCGLQEHTLEAFLLVAQRRKQDVEWVKRQLMFLCTPEACSRYLRRQPVEGRSFLCFLPRSLKAFLAAQSQGHNLDWVIYTFSSSDIALEPLLPGWSTQCLKLAIMSSADDAQRHIKDFFQSDETYLFVQCVLKEGEEEVHRMIEHLMRMVAEVRYQHPSKWIIFIAHIVKSHRPLRLPLCLRPPDANLWTTRDAPKESELEQS